MAWASRFTKSNKDPLTKAINDGIKTRVNVPRILDLSDRFGVPITWATVGHLFLRDCGPFIMNKHPDLPRLGHFENQYWKFDKGDWFDFDPCSDYIRDPSWYAPDLIKDILSRTIRHEIGCHTFSHIDCRENIDDGKVLGAELRKCIEVANEWGLTLKAFVHPGHTIGYLKMLEDFGFTSFRTNYQDTLSSPQKHHTRLWEFRNTAEISWRSGWSAAYHIHRYKTIVDRAIKYNRLCVLWFHPSFDSRIVELVLPALFQHLDEIRGSILLTTHTEYAEWLNSH